MYKKEDNNSTLVMIILKIKFKSVCGVLGPVLLKHCQHLIRGGQYHYGEFLLEPSIFASLFYFFVKKIKINVSH